MARSRNIKPGFFANEALAECTPWARLAFAGLWTLADRAGRLEDRPKRIKAFLFPYDDVEADGLLAELADHGFIVRYSAGGKPLIQVVNFLKHQTPHMREADSVLPAPPSTGAIPAVAERPTKLAAQDSAQAEPVQQRGSPGAGTGQAQCSHESSPSDSGFLIPDSLSSGAIAPAAASPPPELPVAPSSVEATISDQAKLWALVVRVFGDKGRGLGGKLVKQYGAEILATVLADAIDEEPVDPKAWVTAGCEAAARRRDSGAPGRTVPDAHAHPRWLGSTGFASIYDAESAGCGAGNAHKFRNGKKVAA